VPPLPRSRIQTRAAAIAGRQAESAVTAAAADTLGNDSMRIIALR